MPKDTLSKRIRDLQRLLKLDSLPETTRNEKERALASLQAEKTTGARQREVSRMTQKYKMVKFVEHQKAVRRLAKAKKALRQVSDGEGDEKKVGDAREQVRRREVDLCYIENFPVLEKYISLYKPADGPGAQATKDRRDEIWRLAEKGELAAPGSRAAARASEVLPKDTHTVIEEEEKDDFFE